MTYILITIYMPLQCGTVNVLCSLYSLVYTPSDHKFTTLQLYAQSAVAWACQLVFVDHMQRLLWAHCSVLTRCVCNCNCPITAKWITITNYTGSKYTITITQNLQLIVINYNYQLPLQQHWSLPPHALQAYQLQSLHPGIPLCNVCSQGRDLLVYSRTSIAVKVNTTLAY